jgi:hypothetical protein
MQVLGGILWLEQSSGVILGELACDYGRGTDRSIATGGGRFTALAGETQSGVGTVSSNRGNEVPRINVGECNFANKNISITQHAKRGERRPCTLGNIIK